MAGSEFNDNKLPSVSRLLSGNDSHTSSPFTYKGYTQLQRPHMGNNNGSNRPHQLKSLLLPRPEYYASATSYSLPVADTRPPAIPPAGSGGHGEIVQSGVSSKKSLSLSKPLPPLPIEAMEVVETKGGVGFSPSHSVPSTREQGRRASSSAANGMDVLLQAAGV